MTLATHTAGARLASLFERLERKHFSAARFTEPKAGTVAAQFFASRITSAFQPVVRASDGGIAGHHALLRVFDAGAAPVAPWRLFAQAAQDATLVQLDRLARTVHALNYFEAHGKQGHLYLNVERRLLTIVSDDHGAYFEMILGELGVPPSRVAIVLPAAALDDPVTFVRAAISYRMRGYRVVAELPAGDGEADMEHVFLAEPHDVALPAPDPSSDASIDRTRRMIEPLSRRGIHGLARRVESTAQAQAARDAGFDFLQGRHFAHAGELTA